MNMRTEETTPWESTQPGPDLRPSLDETFMTMAHVMKTRATCLRKQVGCVVVDAGGFILSTGYNGSPRRTPHCTEVGCLLDPSGSCIRTLHAEMNAILTAGRNGVSLTGGLLYTTARPCYRCSLAIVQSGILWVGYSELYTSDDEEAVITLFERAGVTYRRMNDQPTLFRDL